MDHDSKGVKSENAFVAGAHEGECDENIVVVEEVSKHRITAIQDKLHHRRSQMESQYGVHSGNQSGRHFEASANLNKGTFHFGNQSRNGCNSKDANSYSALRRKTNIKDLVVPNRAGKAKLYVKRMAIGEYTFAEGENEINFEQIQRDETSFYQAEFNRLNSRTKELLRYLRKSPVYG